MTDIFVTQLAAALREVAGREATGALRITTDGPMRMAFFEGGALVYYVSDVPEESLAHALTRPGRLDAPEARAAVARLEEQVTRKKTLVSLVLESAVADPERLRGWLVEHAYESFARAFDSRSGTLKLATGIRAEHPLPFRVGVPTLLLEAVRRMRNEWLVREAVGPLEYTTEPAADHASRLQTLPLSFNDGLVASQVTHRIPLKELVAITGLPEADALRTILALRLSGALDPFKEPKGQTSTGRLRMRQAALESGIPLDAEAAAVALAMAVRPDAAADGGALTMGELIGATTYEPPAEPEPAPAPAGGAQPRMRGDTAKLKLLSSAYKQMAEAEAESGNVAGAVQYYESALDQSPDNLELLMGLSKLLVEKANGHRAAEKLLERARTAHPREVRPRVELAKILRATGRHTMAEEVLREARRLDPDDPEVNAMLQRKEEKAGGGFFARLRGGAQAEEAKPKPEPFASAPRTKLEPVPLTSATGSLVARRCKNCGSMCRPGASACARCGAAV